jgi:hypothetical protein
LVVHDAEPAREVHRLTDRRALDSVKAIALVIGAAPLAWTSRRALAHEVAHSALLSVGAGRVVAATIATCFARIPRHSSSVISDG